MEEQQETERVNDEPLGEDGLESSDASARTSAATAARPSVYPARSNIGAKYAMSNKRKTNRL